MQSTPDVRVAGFPRRAYLAGMAATALPRTLVAASALRVGALNGPQAEMLAFAARRLESQAVAIEIVRSADAESLARDVAAGKLDATASQNRQQLATISTKLVPAFDTITLPMCIYSRRVPSVARLRDGDAIVLPTSRPDQDRARVLLYNYGLLFAHEDGGLDADFHNIVNPRKFTLQIADVQKLAGRLDDAAAVLIPYEAAVAAGLRPGKDSIGLEDGKSPYTQVVAVREETLKKPWLATLARAVQSRETRRYIYDHYGDSVQPPW